MSQNKRQLQIKQLSPNGQLLNCVNCYSGQVSVLRTTVHAAIQPYINAFAGIPGPERFVIELNQEPYAAHAHNLIGFGERFVSEDGTAGEFLARNKIPVNQLHSLFISFGLENCKDLLCTKLSRCEERRLRILAAVYDANKILIINDPFDPISTEWRERFAELLVNFVRTKSQIAIIPFLSYRPECWIDNEFIARIQVGEAIQKTIGFASQSTNIQAMINQIREEHKKDSNENIIIPEQAPAVKSERIAVKSEAIRPPSAAIKAPSVATVLQEWDEPEAAAPRPQSQKNHYPASFYKRHASKIAATGIAFIVLFLFSSYQDRKNSEKIGAKTSEIIAQKPIDLPKSKGSSKPTLSVPVVQIPEDRALDSIPVQDGAKVQVALVMRYPTQIKDSILNSTNPIFNTGLVKKNIDPNTSTAKEPVKQNREAGDFLKLLATAGSDPDGESGPGQNDGPASNGSAGSLSAPDDYGQNDPSEEQARREQIRQKFLEAIQRAQEKTQ
jgi:hypothetical protein